MIGAWARAMFPVCSRLPLIAFVMPDMVSLLQPVLREDASPPKRFTAREQFLLYDDGCASPCRFSHLGRTFHTAKIAILLRQVHSRLLHCVALLLSIGVRGVTGKGTRYHIGLAKLEWNIHGL